MADRLLDAEDRALAEAFSLQRIEDDGFSDRVMRRVRVRIWINRLALPVAALIGAAFAFRPALELAGSVASLASLIPVGLSSRALEWLPLLQTIVLGGMLITAAMVFFRILED